MPRVFTVGNTAFILIYISTEIVLIIINQCGDDPRYYERSLSTDTASATECHQHADVIVLHSKMIIISGLQ